MAAAAPDAKRAKPSAGAWRPDWPQEGAVSVDAAVHDSPHAAAQIEWWYVNAHLSCPEDPERRLSLFASFFRLAMVPGGGAGVVRGHALNWAVVDGESYRTHSQLDKDAPTNLAALMAQGDLRADPHITTALREILEKGKVPEPDALFSDPGRESASIAPDGTPPAEPLALDFGGSTFRREADGSYAMRLAHQGESAELRFVPQRRPVRHGRGGCVSTGNPEEDMFYYFIPRCAVTGEITLKGAPGPVKVTGQGWYDHEFGGTIREGSGEGAEQKAGVDSAWEWAAVQLDDGTEVSAATVKDPSKDPPAVVQQFALLVESADGAVRRCDDAMWRQAPEDDGWVSTRTSVTYPSCWQLSVPSAELELTLTAAFPAQEFVTLIAKPAYWEGRVSVSGTRRGKPVSGLGFVECHGHQDLKAMDKFYDVFDAMICDPLRGQGWAPGCDAPPQPALLKQGGEKKAAYICDDIADTVADKVQAQELADLAVSLGQLDPEQVGAAGELLRAIGAAFLLTDSCGQLSPRPPHGRLTVPLVFAVAALPPDERRAAWDWLRREAAPQGAEPPQCFASLDAEACCKQTREHAARLLQARWAAAEGKLPDTFYKMMLRAAGLRLLERAGADSPEDSAAPTVDIPLGQGTGTAADKELWATACAVMPGTWTLDRRRSASINAVLDAQGTTTTVRLATVALVPTLTTECRDGATHTIVKTFLSTSEIETKLDAVWVKRLSPGRGEVETRAWLEDGGATIHQETRVSTKKATGVEHKLMTVQGEWMRETMRWVPDGAEPMEAVRWFRKAASAVEEP